ncbi:hypothetical protein EBU95_05390 [bacterium]|nr:hypothetical protein [bacterium]
MTPAPKKNTPKVLKGIENYNMFLDAKLICLPSSLPLPSTSTAKTLLKYTQQLFSDPCRSFYEIYDQDTRLTPDKDSERVYQQYRQYKMSPKKINTNDDCCDNKTLNPS